MSKVGIPHLSLVNPRQVRWALLLTRFNFKLTYKPDTNNVKADALSQRVNPIQSENSKTEPILPKGIVVSAITPD